MVAVGFYMGQKYLFYQNCDSSRKEFRKSSYLSPPSLFFPFWFHFVLLGSGKREKGRSSVLVLPYLLYFARSPLALFRLVIMPIMIPPNF